MQLDWYACAALDIPYGSVLTGEYALAQLIKSNGVVVEEFVLEPF